MTLAETPPLRHSLERAKYFNSAATPHRGRIILIFCQLRDVRLPEKQKPRLRKKTGFRKSYATHRVAYSNNYYSLAAISLPNTSIPARIFSGGTVTKLKRKVLTSGSFA